MERLRVAREGGQLENGGVYAETTSDPAIRGKSTGYCLRSSSFAGEMGAQKIHKVLANMPGQVATNEQQQMPSTAQQRSDISNGRHVINAISIRNVDHAPDE